MRTSKITEDAITHYQYFCNRDVKTINLTAFFCTAMGAIALAAKWAGLSRPWRWIPSLWMGGSAILLLWKQRAFGRQLGLYKQNLTVKGGDSFWLLWRNRVRLSRE